MSGLGLGRQEGMAQEEAKAQHCHLGDPDSGLGDGIPGWLSLLLTAPLCPQSPIVAASPIWDDTTENQGGPVLFQGHAAESREQTVGLHGDQGGGYCNSPNVPEICLVGTQAHKSGVQERVQIGDTLNTNDVWTRMELWVRFGSGHLQSWWQCH